MPEHPLRQPKSLNELFLYRLSQLTASARLPVVRLCEREHGITRREWRLLSALALGEGITSSALAERSLLDRARTSRTVTSLVAKGLLLRSAAAADRREAVLALTDAGRATYETLLPQVAAINRELLSVLDDGELDALAHALKHLTAQAERMAARP
jgi:DNA-binding MarR family transcriptional regulator